MDTREIDGRDWRETAACIVAIRPEDVPASVVIPRSVTRGPCRGCGAAVLLLPSSVAMIAAGDAVAVCRACMAGLMAERHYTSTLLPGWAEEAAMLRREQAEMS